MKVAMITRSTLYTVRGGDTIQIIETAKQLNDNGLIAEIKLSHETIDYDSYDLLHFFNLTRPADILHHIQHSAKPFVVSPNFIDYSEYDKRYRKGLSGFLFRLLSADKIEYLKTLMRAVVGKDKLRSASYVLKGQRQSITEILRRAKLLLPSSESEYAAIKNAYKFIPEYVVVSNGIDKKLFEQTNTKAKTNNMVLCAARIEGIKNQLNLIKALNDTDYKLLIIGKPAPNQISYYKECKKIAAKNIHFIDHLPQEGLLEYYKQANVHVLPSWFETTGLSSLEAAATGCNIVISNRGYTRDYFGDDAVYCEPDSPQSIFNAIQSASRRPKNKMLQCKIFSEYTWQNAAIQTMKAYKQVLNS